MAQRSRLATAGFSRAWGIFFLLLVPFRLDAARPPLWLSVELGLFRPSSSTLNRDLIPLLNQVLDHLEAEARNLGFKTSLKTLSEIPANLTAAVEVESPIRKNFALVAGIGHWKKDVSGSLEASGELNSYLYGLTDTTKVTGRLIPVRIGGRGQVWWNRWRYFGGVGLTLVFARFEYHSRLQFLDLTGTLEEDNFHEKARGRALLPYVEAGADYAWKEKVRFGLIIRIPVGKIGKFKIFYSSDPQNLGQQAVFIDQAGREKIFTWEITGLQATLALRYLF